MNGLGADDVQWVETDDGCRLWTASSGRGAPVVLCHGGPGLWDYLAPLAGAVDDAFTVHRWDQRGALRSAVVPPYTMQRFVDDLEALREHFSYDAWIVGGHSWGAALALEYALQHPDRTRALVYVSGTGIGQAWRRAYYEERRRRLAVAGVIERWDELGSRERTPDEEREYCALTWATDCADPSTGRETAGVMLADGFLPNYEVNLALSAWRHAEQETTMISRCAVLDVPSLIVHGSEDPRPVSAVRTLVDALPRCTFAVIEGAGHLPWVERPDAFYSVVREFLSPLAADVRR